MKNLPKLACLTLGAVLVTAASTALAQCKAGGCCRAATTTSNKAPIDAQAKPYLRDKCLVSDTPLGEMGKPYVFTYQGQQIKLCCKSCLPDFHQSPATYLKRLAVAGPADKK
jgi:hypothetical protein